VILRRLIGELHMPINLHVCPTEREADGLAMSSRNVFLSGIRRQVAPILFQALNAAKSVYESGETNAERILGAARKIIDAHAEDGAKLKLDYISLAEPEMLNELEEVKRPGAILSGAMFMLPMNETEKVVRLIDNLILD
jgi:pantoate--beta-alanine ligase